VEYEVFLRQVTIACNAGASGIAVGRAVWQDAVTMNTEERINFLRTTAKYRLSRLTSLCHALAKPFTDFYTAEAPFDWYKTY
jgi:tagatose-1,6-bisphosphate aldolase